jgi:hypothetical protein
VRKPFAFCRSDRASPGGGIDRLADEILGSVANCVGSVRGIEVSTTASIRVISLSLKFARWTSYRSPPARLIR